MQHQQINNEMAAGSTALKDEDCIVVDEVQNSLKRHHSYR